jgi:hypothetical protein
MIIFVNKKYSVNFTNLMVNKPTKKPFHFNTKVSQNESVTFYMYYFTRKYWRGNRICNFARMIGENDREARGHTFPHRKGVITEEGGYCTFGATIGEKSCLRTTACHR